MVTEDKTSSNSELFQMCDRGGSSWNFMPQIVDAPVVETFCRTPSKISHGKNGNNLLG
jgi:hypothetical protein